MDFSVFLVIPLSACIAFIAIVGAAVVSRPPPHFQWTFLASFVLALLLLQPWQITSWMEVGTSAVMLVMIALWVAIGHVIGVIPAAVLVYLGRKITALIRR